MHEHECKIRLIRLTTVKSHFGAKNFKIESLYIGVGGAAPHNFVGDPE